VTQDLDMTKPETRLGIWAVIYHTVPVVQW